VLGKRARVILCQRRTGGSMAGASDSKPISSPNRVMITIRPGGTVAPMVHAASRAAGVRPSRLQSRELQMADDASRYRSAGRSEQDTSGWVGLSWSPCWEC
jgi:hypothetical protein